MTLNLGQPQVSLVAPALANPPREFSLMPFWFWNDELTETEIARQMDDFEAHGVFGFVIHPRVGLPRDIGFMSERMGHFVRFAVNRASERGLKVILYDEGMYPSGSAAGLVVKANPKHHCRGLARVELDPGQAPSLEAGWNLISRYRQADGREFAIIDRPIDTCIRGVHYIGEGPEEDEPTASDILNPDAVASFLRIVYDGYHRWVGEHFGKTVIGIFTDEPGMIGRCRERGIMPGSAHALTHVARLLGCDPTPKLPLLWEADDKNAGNAEAAAFRGAYKRALDHRLQETYYRPLHDWCEAHGVHLMGHPAEPGDIGCERWFHTPGQDMVWRWVLAGTPSAIEGDQSTQGKCASSAMIHQGRRRNSNELYGAYGHEFTWREMKGLADWCFVRGTNMLFPHAFYYSIRGPRWDERPPDVGPNSAWWGDYKRFADYCARLSWLNTDSVHFCRLAILGESEFLPWRAAKACFQNQRDFNYVEARDLWESAKVDDGGIHLAGMHYESLIIEKGTHVDDRARPAIAKLRQAGRLIEWSEERGASELLARIDQTTTAGLRVQPAQPDLRYRQMVKDGVGYVLLINEGNDPIEFSPALPPGEWGVYDAFENRLAAWQPGQAIKIGVAESRVMIAGTSAVG